MRRSLPPLRRRGNRAFSLVEMLVVIAIIGLLAAMAIMAFETVNVRDVANSGRDHRNAQAIATIFMAGETAGADFLVPGDLEATVDKVVAGISVSEGVFTGNSFSVNGISEEAKDEALKYLELSGGILKFKPETGTP